MCGRFAKFSDNEAIARSYFQRPLAGPQGQTGYNLPPGTDIDASLLAAVELADTVVKGH